MSRLSPGSWVTCQLVPVYFQTRDLVLIPGPIGKWSLDWTWATRSSWESHPSGVAPRGQVSPHLPPPLHLLTDSLNLRVLNCPESLSAGGLAQTSVPAWIL